LKRFSLLAVSIAVDSNRALEVALCMKKEGGSNEGAEELPSWRLAFDVVPTPMLEELIIMQSPPIGRLIRGAN